MSGSSDSKSEIANPKPFGVIIFSGASPRHVARIASRIHKEVPEARVCGILYERQPSKTFSKRCITFVPNLREWAFVKYACARVLRSLFRPVAHMGSALLQLMHASPPRPNGPTQFRLEELGHFCETIGASLLVTGDTHSAEALEFVRQFQPDLGIVYGMQVVHPELLEIPRNGALVIYKSKLPDCRGGGPVGLWELLDGQPEIGISACRIEKTLDAGPIIHAMTLPIEPFDTLTSLALKADVIANDLLVRSVADFARGAVQEKPRGLAGESQGAERMFCTPKPHRLAHHKKQIALGRPVYKPARGRPVWKLLLRTALFGPFASVRNWVHRLRGRFPVIILYHHLVTDRPHPMGVPTESFLKQVEFIRKYYRIVSLSEAIEMLTNNNVKIPTVVLTFDDGYKDNFINLRAVTEETGIRAALFVCTQNVSAQQEFRHDLQRGQRSFLPLTWEQIAYLSQDGFEIGSHTRSHFDCGSSDPEALQAEIVGSKADLEQRLGLVSFFSFPWGHPESMSPRAVELAKATYSYVFSAYGGTNFPSPKEKLWHLKRCSQPKNLWELALALQSLLEF